MAHDHRLRTYRYPDRLHRWFPPGFFRGQRTRKSGPRMIATDYDRASRIACYVRDQGMSYAQMRAMEVYDFGYQNARCRRAECLRPINRAKLERRRRSRIRRRRLGLHL